MATILEYRRAQSPTGTSVASQAKLRSAEVVMFPGLRYERQLQAALGRIEIVAPRVRDRLELLD